LRYTLVLWNEGIILKTLNTRKPGRLHYQVANRTWDRANLRVRYGDTGFDNYAEVKNVEEFKKAFSAFTEPELLDYMEMRNGLS
jgi:hypothetical protein